MKKYILWLFCIIALSSFGQSDSDPVVDFLKSLNVTQLEKTQFSFEAETRQNWHFLPVSMWERPGIQIGKLNSSQAKLFHTMLKSHLSLSGYEKTMRIVDLENVLAELSGNNHMRDAKKYHIAVYGNPEKEKVWGWSFEGHHVSLNFTIVDDKVSYTPRFFGASPATIKSGPRKGERTLAREEDLALELINRLNEGQKVKAIFREKAFRDNVSSNSSTVAPLEIVGISISELTDNQQLTISKLIYEYLSAMPKALAKMRMENLKKEAFGNIHFGWAGETEIGKPHYYRIQGKTFLIEFDNTQENANHIHSVWRDFDGDFGRDIIKEHYQSSHH
ncbi:MAG: DUF3500 domain-containing protein [Flavobacteriaceae bacterium]